MQGKVSLIGACASYFSVFYEVLGPPNGEICVKKKIVRHWRTISVMTTYTTTLTNQETSL